MSSAPQDSPSSTQPANAGVPASELLTLVYDELRTLARHRMANEGVAHTLQATALVHEVYLRLAGNDGRFMSRAHFFHAAAEAMRRILIEHARAKGSKKRGGGAKRVPMDLLDLAAAPASDEILAFDEAFARLESETPMAAQVARLRFYAGLSIDETAEALGISPRTVDREWTYARAWLFRLLEKEFGDG
ncbi:MAG TPA: ECF-type sigma factor [Tepidisphaeraceae bacterium]|jgi:RNA polymerase sigma factor (TIGR02999 family)|nr:ECF-type sigma factor [Tepidisphaeraceae bacterium]